MRNTDRLFRLEQLMGKEAYEAVTDLPEDEREWFFKAARNLFPTKDKRLHKASRIGLEIAVKSVLLWKEQIKEEEMMSDYWEEKAHKLEAQVEGMVPKSEYEEMKHWKERGEEGVRELATKLASKRADLETAQEELERMVPRAQLEIVAKERAEFEAQNLDLRVEIGKLKEQLLKWEERRRKEVFG